MLKYVTDNFWQFVLAVNYSIAVFTAIAVILKNYNPSKTLSYLVMLIAFPFIGVIFYYFFGQEYRKDKIFKRKNILNQHKIKKWEEGLRLKTGTIQQMGDKLLYDKVKLIRLLYASERAPLTMFNEVELLVNGEEKFKMLFEDLLKARKSIHLEYYIIKDDAIGKKLLDILILKAKEGVSVRLSYDYVGSSLSSETLKELDEAGVEHYSFMPVYFPRFTSKLNYRNHRKIVVIDGSTGYVGGINVSDRYTNNQPGIYWRDTHLRIRGEAVGSLQLHFLLNWDFLSEEDLVVEDIFFPENTIKTKTLVQIAASGPDSDFANIMEAIFTAINTADKYIYITTPYFIPNPEIMTALMVASKGGVNVKLLIPKESDSWAAKYATYSYIQELLECGVEVFLYTKGFVHAKSIIIDDIFSTVGTANMDYRSFNLNFEINALVYDREFASKMIRQFNEDLEFTEKLCLEGWSKRKYAQKIMESFSRIWAPML